MIKQVLTVTLVMLAIPMTTFGQAADAKPAKKEQPAKKEKLTEEEKSVQRMAFMQKAISRFNIHVPGDDAFTANVTEKPLLRWVNPQSTAKDGILTAFVAGGRPLGMTQVAINQGASVIHEFHMLADKPFQLRRGESVMWDCTTPTLEMIKLPDASAPRDSKVQRISQMRRLASQFEVWDDHGWNEKVRQQLRLLTQPVYRYEDEPHKVIDGAVFVFGLANDPECVLLVEACKDGDDTWWQYCLSPVTIYALEAKLGDNVVWAAPERKVFGRGYLTQYVSPYRKAADDPDLKLLMPKDD